MEDQFIQTRLPRTFHRSFSVDRSHISQLLRYVKDGYKGNKNEISAKTGIPTGTSSGKVEPTIDYAKAMGLITCEIQQGNEQSERVYVMKLTPLGETLIREDDSNLNTEVSQWICHLNLCSRKNGADVWYKLFAQCKDALQTQFTWNDVHLLLNSKYELAGNNSSDLWGPTKNMYNSERFNLCTPIMENGGTYQFQPAPLLPELIRVYGAWIINLIENHFPNQEQISIKQLEEETHFLTIAGWNDYQKIFTLLENKGILSIDRHMNPWLLTPKIKSSIAWTMIYDDLI